MKHKQPLKVMMLGLRGFPRVQGGVETHAEHLCPLLVEMGCDVTVLARSPYQHAETGSSWKGVNFISLWAPKSKALEAIAHTFLGVLYAAVKRPDILHIQAIGPAMMTPLAKLLGLNVVVTHHGPDYDRQKWGGFARFILKLGERFGMRWSNQRIVISKVIADLVRDKHSKESELIHNGVVMPELLTTTHTLDKFNLIPGRYVLLVGRLVKEKRHLDLIAAFKQANLDGWKLVLVGGADHPDEYEQEVMAKAKEAGAVTTGFQRGLALQELYTHAGLFVLPSSHEGLSIALLEALSYGLTVLASDIPANLEIGLIAKHYFPLGNIEAFASKIRLLTIDAVTESTRENTRNWVATNYNWHHVAEKTLNTYLK